MVCLAQSNSLQLCTRHCSLHSYTTTPPLIGLAPLLVTPICKNAVSGSCILSMLMYSCPHVSMRLKYYTTFSPLIIIKVCYTIREPLQLNLVRLMSYIVTLSSDPYVLRIYGTGMLNILIIWYGDTKISGSQFSYDTGAAQPRALHGHERAEQYSW